MCSSSLIISDLSTVNRFIHVSVLLLNSFTKVLLLVSGQGSMWQPSWQGANPDGAQQPPTAQHPAGPQQQQEENFSDMFRMLDQQGQEFSDLSGMFNTFTD